MFAGGELLFDATSNGHGNVVGRSGASSGAATPTPPSGSGSSAFDLNDFPLLDGSGPGGGAPGGGGSGVGGGGSDGLATALRQQQQLMLQQQQLMSQQQLQQPGGGNKQSNLYRIATAGQGDINIATEDFPALPGSGSGSGSGGGGAPGSGLLGTSGGGGGGGLDGSGGVQRSGGNNPESGGSSPFFGGAAPTVSRTPSNGSSGGLGLFDSGDPLGAGAGAGAGGAADGTASGQQLFDGLLGGFGNIGGGGTTIGASSSSPRSTGGGGGGGGGDPPSSSGGASSSGGGGGGGGSGGGGSGGGDNPTSSGGGSALSSDFGLLGLLSIIRMTDADRNALALGSDLTSLGMNLKSIDKLYNTFASPWSDSPTTREPQYQLPMCYYMQPPALKTGHLSKFQLETLFYIFYALPKDVLQAYSAQELYSREWRYHVDLKLWFKLAGPGEANSGVGGNNSSSNDGNQYIYFDTNTWERRLFNGNVQNITSGLLSEDDVRVKFSSS